MKESEIIEKYEAAKTYEEQQAVINSTKHPGKTKYMLIQKGLYQKKVANLSEEKKTLINAFEIVTGTHLPSMGNMSMRDLKKLWSFIARENNRYESGD